MKSAGTSSSTPTTTACSWPCGQGDYKYVFAEQRLAGTMQVWAEPFTKLRLQKIYNLFQDPYERADITSNTFWDWQLNHVGSIYGVMDDVVKFAATFKEFPPRSIPPSFTRTDDGRERPSATSREAARRRGAEQREEIKRPAGSPVVSSDRSDRPIDIAAGGGADCSADALGNDQESTLNHPLLALPRRSPTESVTRKPMPLITVPRPISYASTPCNRSPSWKAATAKTRSVRRRQMACRLRGWL